MSSTEGEWSSRLLVPGSRQLFMRVQVAGKQTADGERAVHHYGQLDGQCRRRRRRADLQRGGPPVGAVPSPSPRSAQKSRVMKMERFTFRHKQKCLRGISSSKGYFQTSRRLCLHFSGARTLIFSPTLLLTFRNRYYVPSTPSLREVGGCESSVGAALAPRYGMGTDIPKGQARAKLI